MNVFENLLRLKNEYSNLLITDIDFKGNQHKNDYYLYDLRYIGRGKRLAEVHYKPDDNIYHLVFKYDLCTPSEITEMKNNKRNTANRGVLYRTFSEEELLEFLRKKLNKTSVIE